MEPEQTIKEAPQIPINDVLALLGRKEVELAYCKRIIERLQAQLVGATQTTAGNGKS